MAFRIRTTQKYVECHISGNLTLEEYFEAIAASHDASVKVQTKNFFVSFRNKDPQFTLVTPVLREIKRVLGTDGEYRIAAVVDDRTLALSIEYGVLIGRQLGIEVRGFRNAGDAIAWLAEAHPGEGAENDLGRPGPDRQA